MACSAPFCKNERSMGCVMFPFPSDPILRASWIQQCRKGKWDPDGNDRICEVHFESSQYEHEGGGLLKLKPGAVPTLFNFPVSVQVSDGSVKLKKDQLPDAVAMPIASSPTIQNLTGKSQPLEKLSILTHVPEGEAAHQSIVRINKELLDKSSFDEAWQLNGEESATDGSKYMETCRLCASGVKTVETVNVFEAEIESFELINIIEQCLQIQISEEDTLPKNVCLQCCEKLADFFEFFSSCANSQKSLAEQYPSSKILPDNSDYLREEQDRDRIETTETSPIKKRSSRKRKREKMTSPSRNELENDPDCNENTSTHMIAIEESGELQFLQETITPGLSTQEVFANYRWECNDCGVVLESLNALKEHHAYKHNQPPIFKCSQCGKAFTIYKSFVRHVKIHFQPKRFGCTRCGKKFAQKNILQSHLMLHTNLRPFVCPHCRKSFRQNEALYNHLKSHLPKEARSDVVCPVCRKMLSSKHRLSTHMMKMHSGSREFACRMCGIKLVSQATLDHHRQTHSKDRANYCDLCTKTFPTIGQFNQHNKLLHPDVTFYQCHVCEKDFRDSEMLEDHARCHLAYVCEYCGKGFRSKGILRVHLHQHSGKRPYRCAQCSRNFSSSAGLNQHSKAQHGQVLLFENYSPPATPPRLDPLETSD